MIRIRQHSDFDQTDQQIPNTKFLGYRVESDKMSSAELFELDLMAARQALNRYLRHRDRIWNILPSDIQSKTVWKIHGRGRIPIKFLWKEFHVYFLIAKIRILLSNDPQPVECDQSIDKTVSLAVVDICEDFDVEYRGPYPQTNQNNHNSLLHIFYRDYLSKLNILNITLDSIQRWLILFLYTFVRPVVLKLHHNDRLSTDVRFWQDPSDDNNTRFQEAPNEVTARGMDVSYATHNFLTVYPGIKTFIKGFKNTVKNGLNEKNQIPIEWYIEPTEFRRAIYEAPELFKTIQKAVRQTEKRANSPEYIFLAKHIRNTVSTQLLFRLLLIKSAMEGFACSVRKEVWCYSQHPLKVYPRLINDVGEQECIKTIGVAPSYFSERSPGTKYTKSEINGPEAISHPDFWAVFEPGCAETLKKEKILSEITVVRDKFEEEVIMDRDDRPTCVRKISNNPELLFPNQDKLRVLVLLTIPTDNKVLLESLQEVGECLHDFKFVFKPHPLFPPEDDLFEKFEVIHFAVTSIDASLAKLAESCDICISMYSTAAVPAFARGTPVIWAPLQSPNHIRIDLLEKVGIRADNPEELAESLNRLGKNEVYYQKKVKEGIRFANDKLLPDRHSPSIADIIEKQAKKT